MCRIFGFRSVLQSKVHSSLVSADNALMVQSEDHPDGWGVAYYIDSAPHIIKSVKTAFEDHLFKKVSGIVTSETVVAHIRKATLGTLSTINTHPFQFGKWIFAHNGNIKNFDQHREKLLTLINPDIVHFVLGDTDSEVLFFILLSFIQKNRSLTDDINDLATITPSIKEAINAITSIVGPYTDKNDAPSDETFLTFLLTNGASMIAFNGGKNLYYSTYKTLCSERDTCPNLSPECEKEVLNGHVNHLVLSSEPLKGENVWTLLKPGTIIGVNDNMMLSMTSIR